MNANEVQGAWPSSIGIAGAWGYIGRKFLEAAFQLGLQPTVFDPGPPPEDLNISAMRRLADETDFYRQPLDLYHLAVAPQFRDRGINILLERSRNKPIAILNEKPMATPEHPEHCGKLIDAVENSNALMLFDFLELFSPITEAIVDHLAQFKRIEIHSIEMQRTKDREDVSNLRNYKPMVHIQYQESVHCLAWVLLLISRLKGGLAESFADGIEVEARAEPYAAPEPKNFPFVVDGRCDWQLNWSGMKISGCTNFKRHALWSKRRIVRGTADGKAFEIEAEYLEGKKQFMIDGIDQHIDPNANSYVDVLKTFSRWRREIHRDQLMHGIFPNPRFAQITYQLSSALWRASYDRKPIRFDSYASLAEFSARFVEEVPRFARY